MLVLSVNIIVFTTTIISYSYSDIMMIRMFLLLLTVYVPYQGRIRSLKSGGGANHGERGERGAEGVGCEKWVSPSHLGRALGRWLCFLPRFFFFDFRAQSSKFWCILGANFIAVELSV